MPLNYTWTGNSDTNWSNSANWLNLTGAPVPGTDFFNFSTAVFGQGANVTGAGAANFWIIDGDAHFSGAFSATGLPAFGLSPFLTSLIVNAGTTTFDNGSFLDTGADVLVGYLPPFPGSATAELDFLAGTHATLRTDKVIDNLGNRIGENSLYVGQNADGIVNILGTGTQVITDSGITLATNAGITGTMHVGDHALLNMGFTNSNFGVYVGFGGTGNLLIDGGAKVSGDGFANIGVLAGSSGTVVVDGVGSDWHQVQTIAVGFFAGSTGLLDVRNGAKVESDASIRIGAGGTVIVESGGTLNSTGTSGIGARIALDSGATLLMSAGSSVSALGNNPNSAFVGVQVGAGAKISGIGTISGTYIINDGTIEASSFGQAGTLLLNSVLAPIADPGTPGILSISGNATLEIMGGVDATETVVFNNTAEAGFHETLRIDGPLSAFHAPISGLQAGDVIDLAGVSGGTTWSLNSTTDVLTVKDQAGVQLGSLQLLGNTANTSFGTAIDPNGGFSLTVNQMAQAPVITSGGAGIKANYIINARQADITTVAASGTDVHYFIKDAKTGQLVTSTKLFAIDTNSGHLTFAGPHGDGAFKVTVVAKGSAGIDTQAITVKVADEHIMVADRFLTDTFVFHSGFRNDLVLGFQAADASAGGRLLPHDVMQLDHALFTGGFAGEAGAQLSALLTSHTQQLGPLGTVINTDTGDHILIAGVSQGALISHASDFILI